MIWVCVAVALVAFLAFARTIPFEFVYDDDIQVLRNPWIRDWSKVGWFFSNDVWKFSETERMSNYYRPFHMVAHALGYRLSGLEPHGYHVLNIALHGLCSILVAFFGLRLTGNLQVGAAAGLIFAVHPVHVESVAWIAGVTDPLCAAFFFGALHCHLSEGEGGAGRRLWIATLALFFGALLSKEMAFTFPVIAAWLDYSIHGKLRWSRYAGMAAVFALYAALRISALSQFFVQAPHEQLDVFTRLLSSIVLFAGYLAKQFVPFDLNAFHVFRPATSLLDWRFGAGFLFIAAYGAAAWFSRVDRKILFLLGFSVLTLAPLMNISGVGENVFADRYLYIPTLGSCVLIPIATHRLWNRMATGGRFPAERAAQASLGLVFVVYGVILWNVTSIWRNNETLYTETLKRSPQATLIVNNLARLYFYRGDYAKAEGWYRRAGEMSTASDARGLRHRLAAISGLGGIYYQQNRLELALRQFEKAYELDPREVSVLQNLGTVHLGLKNFERAVEYYAAGLSVNPRNEISHNNIAAIYLAARDHDRAIHHAQKALEIFPKYADASLNLGRAFAAKGMKAEARQAFVDAGEFDPTKTAAAERELRALEEATGAQPPSINK